MLYQYFCKLVGLTQLAYFSVGEAKCGVDSLPALLPLRDSGKIFERSNKTYNITHQPPIVTIA